MKYIIDGYNVIHQIAQLQGKRLRSQREGLIRLLENAQAKNSRLKNLTVVFDGQSDVLAPLIMSRTHSTHSTVEIIFSRGMDADKKIKRILEASSFTRDIAVVSDDRQIRFYASSLGAKKISVQEFLQKICSSSEKRPTFKLDEAEVKKINQEMEKIWLGGKTK